MIYLPWIVFVIGTAVIVWRSIKTRTDYIRRSADERDKAKAAEESRQAAEEVAKIMRTRQPSAQAPEDPGLLGVGGSPQKGSASRWN
jgi:hypothetical protein